MTDNQEVQLRVAIYLRVSTDEQAEKYGLSYQREAVESVIKSKGKLKDGREAMVLAGENYVYIDDGVSGTDEIDERPAFRRLKEDVINAPEGQKPFDVVAVYKLDRFARKLRILMDVWKFFEDFDIQFISSTESIDTSTPYGRAMVGILGAIAELERDTILERTHRGREQAVLAGVFMGVNAPYGYKKDLNKKLIKFDTEAVVVERIFHQFTIGKLSPQRIADMLTDDKILTPDASAIANGKRAGVSRKTNKPEFWRAERVRDILADEVYTGKYYYDKSKKEEKTKKIVPVPKSEWKLSPHIHEAVILRGVYDLAQLRLKEISSRKELTQKKEQGNLYLLSSLLVCDQCRKLASPPEEEMMHWTGGKDKLDKATNRYSYHYQCNRKNRKKFSIVCPVVPIPAEPLEVYVISFIRQLLSDPQAVYEYQKKLASNQMETQQLEKRKAHLIGVINAFPKIRQSLLYQHKTLMIDTPTLQKELDILKADEPIQRVKLDEIDNQLSRAALSKGYEESFKLYAEKYGKSFDTIVKDRVQLHDLIHGLIDQIVVYSRKRTDKDVIAGKKKENQYIPDRIDIYLKLPQHLLQQLYRHEFVVKNPNLCAQRDSNPRP
jgi:DNA invertase Pin-like site-specific DNA recombinase